MLRIQMFRLFSLRHFAHMSFRIFPYSEWKPEMQHSRCCPDDFGTQAAISGPLDTQHPAVSAPVSIASDGCVTCKRGPDTSHQTPSVLTLLYYFSLPLYCFPSLSVQFFLALVLPFLSMIGQIIQEELF